MSVIDSCQTKRIFRETFENNSYEFEKRNEMEYVCKYNTCLCQGNEHMAWGLTDFSHHGFMR